MSTIGYSDWAVDLANVGAVYPFQGFEVPMVIIGVAFWLGWHIIQGRHETEELEAARQSTSLESTKEAIDRY